MAASYEEGGVGVSHLLETNINNNSFLLKLWKYKEGVVKNKSSVKIYCDQLISSFLTWLF